MCKSITYGLESSFRLEVGVLHFDDGFIIPLADFIYLVKLNPEIPFGELREIFLSEDKQCSDKHVLMMATMNTRDYVYIQSDYCHDFPNDKVGNLLNVIILQYKETKLTIEIDDSEIFDSSDLIRIPAYGHVNYSPRSDTVVRWSSIVNWCNNNHIAPIDLKNTDVRRMASELNLVRRKTTLSIIEPDGTCCHFANN